MLDIHRTREETRELIIVALKEGYSSNSTLDKLEGELSYIDDKHKLNITSIQVRMQKIESIINTNDICTTDKANQIFEVFEDSIKFLLFM